MYGIISAIPISSCTLWSVAKACENTIEINGAEEAGRIIALVSRAQNNAN